MAHCCFIVPRNACIPAGTEVTMTLGTSFMEQDRTERQDLLWKQYRLMCACTRCVLENRDGLSGKYFSIGCQKCGVRQMIKLKTVPTNALRNQASLVTSRIL